MTARRLAPLLALVLLAPLAAAHGPYVATLAQNQTHTYHVDHSAPICLDVITDWVVTLTYTPPTDTLTLTVPGHGSAVGVNGSAQVKFQTPDSCGVFDVQVHGLVVATVAAYRLTISQ